MPPLFIDKQDMIDTYGEKEMIQLTDRNNPKTGTVNETVMNANIDDAEAEIIAPLGCCFSIKSILDIYAASGFVPVINHWAKVITRLHLYSSLERDDSQVTKAYTDVKEEMKELCECGVLVDNAGNEISRNTGFDFVEDTCCCCNCFTGNDPCGLVTVHTCGCSCSSCCGRFRVCL